jgi:hypothetical protein
VENPKQIQDGEEETGKRRGRLTASTPEKNLGMLGPFNRVRLSASIRFGWGSGRPGADRIVCLTGEN